MCQFFPTSGLSAVLLIFTPRLKNGQHENRRKAKIVFIFRNDTSAQQPLDLMEKKHSNPHPRVHQYITYTYANISYINMSYFLFRNDTSAQQSLDLMENKHSNPHPRVHLYITYMYANISYINMSYFQTYSH
jgi:cell division protein YceG involved in septum cleavage